MRFTHKQIWVITFPILVSLLMEHLINMTDTAFLGRVGEVELGASALAGVYYMAIYMLAFGFSIGAQILIGRRNGEGNYKDIGPIFIQGVLFLVGLATLMFTVSRIYTPSVLRSVIDSEQVYVATNDYMKWRVFGFFFSFVAVMFRAFFVGITTTRILTINSLVMVGTNVVLNYLLIFGKFGFPALGISGAAIGSSVAELVSMIFYILYTWKKVDWKKYALFNLSSFNPKLLSGILNISIWTMIQSFLAMATWFLFFIAVEHLGERPLAVSNIVRSAAMFFFMPVSAFAATTSSLVSNLIGAQATSQVWSTCLKTIKMCYLFVIPIGIIILLAPATFLRIYTDDPQLIQATIPSLFVMMSAVLLSTPGSILFNAVSGTGNTRMALFMEFGTLTFYVLYIIYIVFYLQANVAICWTTEHAYWSILLILGFMYMKSGKWAGKKI